LGKESFLPEKQPPKGPPPGVSDEFAEAKPQEKAPTRVHEKPDLREKNELFPVFLEICMNVLDREIKKTGVTPTGEIPSKEEIRKAGLAGSDRPEGEKIISDFKKLYKEMNLEFPEVYGK